MPFYSVASAGNRYTFLGFLNSNNFLIGGSTTAPSSGGTNSSGMIAIKGIKEVPLAVPEDDIVQDTGDDGLVAEFNFDSIETRRYVITYAVENLNTLAAILGLQVSTVAGAPAILWDTRRNPFYNVCLVHQSAAKSQDTATVGQAGWDVYIVNIAVASPLGRNGMNERDPGVYRMSITPQLTQKKTFSGVTMTDSVDGETQATIVKVHTDYPLHIQSFTGDGTAATINLTYTPVSTSKIEIRTETGQSIGVASISTANKTATLAASVGSGIGGNIIYQYQP